MDKPEQGFDILQNAVNSVCGTKEHCFDYAIQMTPYEAFDYVSVDRKIFELFNIILLDQWCI